MTQPTNNYARFFGLLRRLPGADKEEMVRQFTGSRTASLHEMEAAEYAAMVGAMQRTVEADLCRLTLQATLRRLRSAALHQMQLWGIDTARWPSVDAFCLDRRIAGKPFRLLSGEELEALTRKLRAMNKKKEQSSNH